MESNSNAYVHWLETHSLLYQAKKLANLVSGHAVQWQQPYAMPQSEAAVASCSVWFNAYPPSTITQADHNILQYLGNDELWRVFSEIGITALHTGPMKLAGGFVGEEKTPTVDGWFDRISLDVDPFFGSEADYLHMVKVAAKYGAVVAGDVIPGHTGKGADFLLALRRYEDYPGIYDMVEIKKEDWSLLPNIASEWESENLDIKIIEKLSAKGYIPGQLQRVVFSVPGAKRQMTGWDATGEVLGVDGVIRRWVYLHYFKAGQPTMNWLDPAHAAERIIAGDVIKSIHVLRNKIVRLDANPFLGIECKPDSYQAWSEGHPLSVSSSNNIAWFVRKLGGWSFQELNLTLDAIRTYSEYGPDLSYDFISRPALQHAILTQDATFLRFMLQLMREYKINPRTLIHDMQSHDEITYELVHFVEHATEKFNYASRKVTGKDLRNKIVKQMEKLAIGCKTPYNRLSGNGLCTTFVGLIAARKGITDIYNLTDAEKEEIKRAHLLMVMFNAMQPGVVGLSGWDLVGALPLPLEQIQEWTRDGDYRWINRGAYDLLNNSPSETKSAEGVPKAQMLYGPIPEQLQDEESFVAQVKRMLDVRKKYKLDVAEQIAVPKVRTKGAVILMHQLPENLGYEITALNFSDKSVSLKLDARKIDGLIIGNFVGKEIVDLLQSAVDSIVKKSGIINIKLAALQGKVLHF